MKKQNFKIFELDYIIEFGKYISWRRGDIQLEFNKEAIQLFLNRLMINIEINKNYNDYILDFLEKIILKYTQILKELKFSENEISLYLKIFFIIKKKIIEWDDFGEIFGILYSSVVFKNLKNKLLILEKYEFQVSEKSFLQLILGDGNIVSNISTRSGEIPLLINGNNNCCCVVTDSGIITKKSNIFYSLNFNSCMCLLSENTDFISMIHMTPTSRLGYTKKDTFEFIKKEFKKYNYVPNSLKLIRIQNHFRAKEIKEKTFPWIQNYFGNIQEIEVPFEFFTIYYNPRFKNLLIFGQIKGIFNLYDKILIK